MLISTYRVSIAALLALTFTAAQAPGPGSSPAVLLEVIANHTTPEHEDKFVYLRVFSDRTAECQSSKDDAGGKDRPMAKKTLKEADFTEIESVMNDKELAKVKPKYETKYAVVDSWTEWVIKIQRVGQPQFITVLEFSPGLAKAMGRPYPTSLTRLGCTIEKTRSDVTGGSTTVDSGCRSVLGLKDEPK